MKESRFSVRVSFIEPQKPGKCARTMPHSSGAALAKHHHFRSTSARRFTTEFRGFRDTAWKGSLLCWVDDPEPLLELNLSGAVCQDMLNKSVRVVGHSLNPVSNCVRLPGIRFRNRPDLDFESKCHLLERSGCNADSCVPISRCPSRFFFQCKTRCWRSASFAL